MSTLFKNQVVIITGSTEGIGLASAQLFAREGASVVINGRSREKINAARQQLSEFQEEEFLHAITGDISKKAIQQRLIDETVDKFGKIDVLVNNTGGGTEERWIENISDTDWNQTLEKNLTTAFSLSRDVIKHLRANNYGRIVNVSSVAGRHKGRLSGPQYSAAKAGLLGLTRHLAWDLARFNITVNAVAPGFVLTRRALKKWDSRSEDERNRLFISHWPVDTRGQLPGRAGRLADGKTTTGG